jgi:predicted acetyltransferase
VSDPYPLRPIREDEYDAYHLIDEHTFQTPPGSGSRRADELARFEFDRSLAAFDGDRPIGIAAAYTFQLSIPGGTTSAAGVSWVSVLGSHRRRGVLSSIMRRQLADIRERGEPIAMLWASEAGIYHRFGYGRASWHAYLTIRRGEGALRPDTPSDDRLRLRLADPLSVRAELAKVYDAAFAQRPGLVSRNDAWWDHVVFDDEEDRQGKSPLRCMIAEDEQGPRGYALYTGKESWDDGTFLPECRVEISELMAADPAAGAALWTNLLDTDLTSEFHAPLRPVDDPLIFWLADPRRARPQVSDGLWIRLTDLPAALAQRQYACDLDVVLDVTDDILTDNSGRWRLRVADGRPSCERTSAEPDVRLDVADLGAAYLGGTKLGSLAVTGRIDALRPGALARLSTAMSWDPAPWCPSIF